MIFVGIIPARYASTRFPGKPLALIKDKSMIRRVYDQATKCKSLTRVVVATDDERIFNHVEAFGEAIYTSEHHQSGTDRCYEAACLLKPKLSLNDNDVIINIQGDEPFIKPEQIDELCRCFESSEVQLATLVKKIDDIRDLIDPNIVKVVTAISGNALYFSRAPIPFVRDADHQNRLANSPYYRHIGMYAYRYGVLSKITKLPLSWLEKAESLEQLRWLENGFSIYTRITTYNSIGIDTPEDLEKAQDIAN